MLVGTAIKSYQLLVKVAVGASLLTSAILLIWTIIISTSKWKSDGIEMGTGMRIERKTMEMESPLSTYHASRGGHSLGTHMSFDGIVYGGLHVASSFGNYTVNLCDVTTERDIEFISGDTVAIDAAKKPQSMLESCGVRNSAKEIDDKYKLLETKYDTEKNEVLKTAIGKTMERLLIMKDRIKPCEKLKDQVKLHNNKLKWKSKVSEEICYSVNPSNVMMFADSGRWGFSGPYYARDMIIVIFMLLFFWSFKSFNFHMWAEYLSDGSGTAIRYKPESTRKEYWYVANLVFLALWMGFIIWIRPGVLRKDDVVPMPIWTSAGTQGTQVDGMTKMYYNRIFASGSYLMIWVSAVVVFITSRSFYKWTHGMEERVKRVEVGVVTATGVNGDPDYPSSIPTSITNPDPNSNVGFASHMQSTQTWKLSMFGVNGDVEGGTPFKKRAAEYAKRASEFAKGAANFKNVSARSSVTNRDLGTEPIKLKYVEAVDLHSYLCVDDDTIFISLIVPALFICEFTATQSFAYDVEFQLLILASVGFCVLNFFMTIFQKLCLLIFSLENETNWALKKTKLEIGSEEKGASPWYNKFAVSRYNHWVQVFLELVSTLIRTFCIFGMEYVTRGYTKNSFSVDYGPLEVEKIYKPFSATLIIVFILSLVHSWFRFYVTLKCFDMNSVNSALQRVDIASKMFIIPITIVVLLILSIVSWSEYFRDPLSLHIQEDIPGDWYGHRVASVSASYYVLK
jgi:hypothetical protein